MDTRRVEYANHKMHLNKQQKKRIITDTLSPIGPPGSPSRRTLITQNLVARCSHPPNLSSGP